MNRRNFFNRGIKAALVPVVSLVNGFAVAQTNPAVAPTRKSLHIQCGNHDWQPTSEELSEITSLFRSATIDDNGSIVVTRDSIQLTEFQALAATPIKVTVF